MFQLDFDVSKLLSARLYYVAFDLHRMQIIIPCDHDEFLYEQIFPWEALDGIN